MDPAWPAASLSQPAAAVDGGGVGPSGAQSFGGGAHVILHHRFPPGGAALFRDSDCVAVGLQLLDVAGADGRAVCGVEAPGAAAFQEAHR